MRPVGEGVSPRGGETGLLSERGVLGLCGVYVPGAAMTTGCVEGLKTATEASMDGNGRGGCGADTNEVADV